MPFLVVPILEYVDEGKQKNEYLGSRKKRASDKLTHIQVYKSKENPVELSLFCKIKV